MEVLGRWVFLMSEVPLYMSVPLGLSMVPTAFERRWNNFKGSKVLNLNAKARIWP